MSYQTFREKKEKESGARFHDRQNTKWKKEIADKCNHDWKPLTFALENRTIPSPDMSNGRVYCVCMSCLSHTWIETAYVGFYIGSPDLLEEPEE